MMVMTYSTGNALSEESIAAKFTRIASILSLATNSEALAFGDTSKTSRRFDFVVTAQNQQYVCEFKKLELTEIDLMNCLVHRDYAYLGKREYPGTLAGFIFVGNSHRIPKTSIESWRRLLDVNLALVDFKQFARFLAQRAILSAQSSPTHVKALLPGKLNTLTLENSGYPEYYDESWLKQSLQSVAKLLYN